MHPKLNMKQIDYSSPHRDPDARAAALIQSPVQALLFPLTKLLHIILYFVTCLLRLLTVDLFCWLFQRHNGKAALDKANVVKLKQRFAMANAGSGLGPDYPPKRNNYSDSSKDDIDSYQDFHKRGYDYISKALTMDEASHSKAKLGPASLNRVKFTDNWMDL